MSATTLRMIIALVFFVHGVGHVMAFFPILGFDMTDSWNAQSWLLTGLLGDGLTRAIGFILFLAATLGFLGAALSLMGWLVPHAWWRTLAIYSAVISLIALAIFWNAFATFFPNKVGAIAVNIAVLAGLIWLNWPQEAAIGY